MAAISKSVSFKRWLFRQHNDMDDIGGLARVLREYYETPRFYVPAPPMRFTYRSARKFLEARARKSGINLGLVRGNSYEWCWTLTALEDAYNEWRSLRASPKDHDGTQYQSACK